MSTNGKTKAMAGNFAAMLQARIDAGENRRDALRSLAKKLPRNYTAYKAENFAERIGEKIEAGANRRTAIMQLAEKFPKLHAAYVEAQNMEPAEAPDIEKPAAEFDELVEAEIEEGKSRRKAAQAVAIREPVLFDAWTKHNRKRAIAARR